MDVSLECRGVGKSFGTTVALSNVDLSLSPGEIRGLVGRNGAGKSTLLRCVLGLIKPDTGSVRVLGRDAEPVAGSTLDGVAGLVDGTRWPTSMRVDAVLRMLAAYDRRVSADVELVVDRMSLGPLRRSRVGSLSLGGRQRLGVAAALLRRPKLLLLDEPVNGLDPAGRRDLRLLLRELADDGTAVVISSHDLTEIAATCETVTRLDAGKVSWTKPLAEVAHTADKRVRATTSDDVAAMVAVNASDSLSALTVSTSPGGDLMITGPAELLDQASLVITGAGVAIRRWEPETDLAAALLAPAPDEAEQDSGS